jgi:uncharacterized membrane protein
MNKPWKIVLVLLGIFLAGGVTGAFVMLRIGHQWIAHRPGPEQWAPNHLKRLVERLDLKPEQAEAIRPIVHRNMEELSRLRIESMADIKRVFERMEREVSAQLTPEQRTKFEQLNKEMRERAKRFTPDRKNRPGAGPQADPAKPDAGPPEKPPGN